MPDGTNADDTGTDDQDPGTPADQVNGEIVREGVLGWWRALFGLNPTEEYQAGGGGAGGQFMFASIEELDTVITRWEDERDGILADREKISEAYYSITPPAGDSMSRGQATASQDSLANMWHHNDAMLKYAENYIAKLKASRRQMSLNEEGADARFRTIQA
ncbi:hypothetical protein [Actinophytocola oryzae]|uniref:hypothetical protein n=1 Tax=Actinophytocola oryzae TaxID=502181 RepID=UPI001062A7FB|nr:hypothetical protein [Actinophytocola oryzae]